MPPPQQKPVAPSLPVDSSCAFTKRRAVQHVGAQLRLVELGLHRAPVVVVARIAAERRQAVGREREEALHRRAPRHVLDVRIQAAVLVDHQHRRQRPVARRLHQVAAHLVARCRPATDRSRSSP